MKEPSGDEILILADFFKCDYYYFISNEKYTSFEQTEKLYRKYGNEFTSADRMAIQEFIFLCENESYVLNQLGRDIHRSFSFQKRGDFYKQHGFDAALALRAHLGLSDNMLLSDLYSEFRKIGLHVFRRKLSNSKISGLYIKHNKAGNCILVNYSEDIYRQRFTVAHEVAHSILDTEADFIVSFTKWEKNRSY